MQNLVIFPEKKTNLKLFTGNANPELAQEIAEYLGVKLGAAKVQHFSDGEISLIIDESVRGSDAYIIQPTCTPVNDNLMELLIMIDALRRASAKRITAVLPYYGYARQDRKSRGREPITAKLVANLITKAGARRVLAMDLGGVARARNLAAQIGVPLAIIDKRRPRPNVSEIMNIIGDIEGKEVILVDDMIDTAGTITNGAQALMDRGAKCVDACCTHAVLSGPAIERIEKSPIQELVTTNTIPMGDKKCDKIKVLSVAPIIGEAILRIHLDNSVSELFE